MRIIHIMLIALISTISSLAVAGPVVNDLFAFRQQNSANSNYFATGDTLFWGANDVPGGASLYGVTRQCPVGGNCTAGPPPAGPDTVRQALYYRSFTTRPDQYFASRSYDSTLTGPWTLIVSSDPNFPSNPSLTTVVNTPAVGNAGLMPFVPSMTVTGAGLTPTLTWTLPSTTDLQAAGVTVDANGIFIVDNTPGYKVTATSRSPFFQNSFQQGDLIYRTTVSGTSFQVPTGVLQFGHQYSIGVVLTDNRNDGTPLSRSVSYFDFTPLNLPIPNVYLPTTVPVPTTSGLTTGSLYSFSQIQVGPNSVTFIDPVVATGFEYHIGNGDPNFKTVQIATNVGDGSYEVWIFQNGTWTVVDTSLAVNEVFDFTTLDPSGVDAFQIRGIEDSAGLSPFDVSAFVTGLTFMSDGTFNGTMQALVTETAAIPEPPVLVLLLTAFGIMMWRQRQSS